jgi:trk system potassium uptake protein TrkA
MQVLIVGCGRVGSEIARRTVEDGHDVTVVDEDVEAFRRLPDDFPGRLVHGHGLDVDMLVGAGIAEADAVVVATDGDNTNIVIGQVAQKRFGRPCVVTRVLDPGRAKFYASQGMQTVCPTSTAIDTMYAAICAPAGAVS